MKFLELQFPGVFLITPLRRLDERGFFAESFRRDLFDLNIPDVPNFVQDNLVHSGKLGTLRGLHFQALPHAQGKLVSCISGSITDVIVDLREGSVHYGDHLMVELSSKVGEQLWVPHGFAHGYITREPNSYVSYKVTDYYAPDAEGTLSWNDPDLAIDWGIAANDTHVSPKDKAAQSFASFQTPFTLATMRQSII